MSTPGLQEIDHNGRVFGDLVAVATARAQAGRYRSALQWCRTAAGFATANPVGLLRSPGLEQAVDAVAAALPVVPALPVRIPGGPGRKVLHVLSEAAPIGGLTRLVERWVQHDASSVSSIVLTRQESVAARLRDAVDRSGGTIVGLSDAADAFERAATLRGLGQEADLVVCHLQSDDAIACAAFGDGYRGAPVAFANHGDHIFWMAPTRAQLIVSNRDVARLLSTQVRGYAETSNHVLPLVVPEQPRSASRGRIRSDLGVTDHRPIAVSVARAVKFQDTVLRPRFADLVAAALDAVPELVYCAVGPEPTDEPWPRLQQRYGTRVIVTGPVADPQPLLDAADLYLDTFPFSSTTSLLEASASDLAVVTLDGHHGLRRMLGIPTFVSQAADRPVSIGELSSRISVLARDSRARRNSALAARSVYESYYSASRWPSQLEGMYSALRRLQDQDAVIGSSPAPATDAALRDYCAALWAIEQRDPLQWRILANLSGFDRRDRLEWSVRSILSRVLSRTGRHRDAESVLRPGHVPRGLPEPSPAASSTGVPA